MFTIIEIARVSHMHYEWSGKMRISRFVTRCLSSTRRRKKKDVGTRHKRETHFYLFVYVFDFIEESP